MNAALKNSKLILVWRVLLALFCFSIFTSKSGISIFGVFLIITSAFLIDWKDLVQNYKPLIVFSLLYPLAILVNLFSLGGTATAAEMAISWPWLLLVFPAYSAFTRKSDHRLVIISLLAGLIVACLYSYFVFFYELEGVFTHVTRVNSFWDTSRWGLFLASCLPALFAAYLYSSSKKEKKKSLGIGLLTLVCLSCLVLSNSRAPWMGAVIGSFLFFCAYPRRLIKLLILPALVMVVLFYMAPSFHQRVLSIINVSQSSQGHITSPERSNEARLHMWKVALSFYKNQPWFGTGFNNTETHLKKFFQDNPEIYNTYYTTEFSYRDQHSSYLSLLVQMGLLFSLIFWGVFLFLAYRMLRYWYATRSLWAAMIISLTATHMVIFVFYSSIFSYDMIALFPLMALIPPLNLKSLPHRS